MRVQFNEQMEQLHQSLTAMGHLCEEAITATEKALSQEQRKSLPQVMRLDAQIDQKKREIEALCMKLLLHQQPIAGDLRQISAATRMISDMERIGDQTADIAEILRYVEETALLDGRTHVKEMAQSTKKMVVDSVSAFVQEDWTLAQQVITQDDNVDGLFLKVKAELKDVVYRHPDLGETALDLLMIAKYFERIGDHAVNIAEWVCYFLKGVLPKSQTTDE